MSDYNSENPQNHNNSIQSLFDRPITRRDLMIGGATALALAALAGRACAPEQVPVNPTEVILHPNKYFEFESVERPVNLEQYNLGWAPDGLVSFMKSGNEHMFWISCARNSYSFGVKNSKLHNPALISKSTEYGQYPWKNAYSALTSVFKPFDDSDDLYAFTHNEQWQSPNNGSNFTASVGLSISRDGGNTFQDVFPIPIIEGRGHLPPGSEVTGAGQPCGIVVEHEGKKYLNIYYTEWLPSGRGAPDQIYMARAEIDDTSRAFSPLEYFTANGFSPSNNGLLPVITPPGSVSGANYSALAGVNYNLSLEKFLCTFETDRGVCITASDNGIIWEDPELAIEYPNPLSSVWAGKATSSYSYPTLLSLEEESSQFTSDSVTMVLAKNIGPNSAHSMVMLEGHLKV